MRRTLFWCVLVCLGIACSAAASEPPTPTPAKSGQEHQQHSENINQRTKSGDRVAEKSSSPVTQPQPPQTGNIPSNAGGQHSDKPSTDWWITCFTGVLAGVAVLQFFALIAQAVYMGIGLRHARKTVEKELRAYVHLETIIKEYRAPNMPTPDRYTVSLRITNAGKTWARNLKFHTDTVRNPTTADPFDSIQWNPNEAAPLALGPGQSWCVQFRDVQFSELLSIASGGLKVFYVAWVTYEDTVSSPPGRWQTQLSQEIIAGFEGDISYRWMPTHNCADEDCQQADSASVPPMVTTPPPTVSGDVAVPIFPDKPK